MLRAARLAAGRTVAFGLALAADLVSASADVLGQHAFEHPRLSRAASATRSLGLTLLDAFYGAERTALRGGAPLVSKPAEGAFGDDDLEPSAYDVLEAHVLAGRAVVRIPDLCPAPVFLDADDEAVFGAVVGG